MQSTEKPPIIYPLAVFVAWVIIGGLSWFFYSIAPMDGTSRLAFWLYFFAIPLATVTAFWRIVVGCLLFVGIYTAFVATLFRDGGSIIGFLWPMALTTSIFLAVLVGVAVIARRGNAASSG